MNVKILKEIDLSKQNIIKDTGVFLLCETGGGILNLYEICAHSHDSFDLIKCFEDKIYKVSCNKVYRNDDAIEYYIDFDFNEDNPSRVIFASMIFSMIEYIKSKDGNAGIFYKTANRDMCKGDSLIKTCGFIFIEQVGDKYIFKYYED